MGKSNLMKMVMPTRMDSAVGFGMKAQFMKDSFKMVNIMGSEEKYPLISLTILDNTRIGKDTARVS